MRDYALNRVKMRERYWQRKQAELCTQCGAKLLPEWGAMCPECAEARRNSTLKYIHSRKGLRTKRRQQRQRYETHRDYLLAKRRAWWQARVLAGICTHCKQPATDGNHCAKHAMVARAASAAYARRLRARLLADGVCTRCGGPVDRPRASCKECRAINSKSAIKSRRKKRIEWKAAGLCRECGRDPMPGLTTCGKCTERKRAVAQRQRDKRKEAA